MFQSLLQWFHHYPEWAFAISIAVSILVALAGVLPSVFVTAANIYFFGFALGTAISVAGEAVGAAVTFLAYRFWFRQGLQHRLQHFPKAQRLLTDKGGKAAWLVLALRLLPFVPSGLVTFAAAIGSMAFGWFLLASTVGKIPALLLEAMLVKGFLAAAWPAQVALSVVAVLLAALVWYHQSNKMVS